jgi:hypothetical protein
MLTLIAIYHSSASYGQGHNAGPINKSKLHQF